MAAEREQERLDDHDLNVQRAKERLSQGTYTDRWQHAGDLALVEGQDEDRPQAKVQDMLREMMTSKEASAASCAQSPTAVRDIITPPWSCFLPLAAIGVFSV